MGLLLMFASWAIGQSYEDVVYLKNGGIMRGQIIEQVPNKSLKIETVGRNVFVYSFDEIERIVKEEVGAKKKEAAPLDTENWDRGRFTFIVEGGMGVGAQFNANGTRINSYGGNLSFGMNLVPKVCLGLGGGFDVIGSYAFIPIFVDFRYFFLNQPITPYLTAAAGYSIGPGDYDQGGWYANPQIGLRYDVARKAGLNFGLGYRLQTQKVFNYFGTMGFLSIKVGAMF